MPLAEKFAFKPAKVMIAGPRGSQASFIGSKLSGLAQRLGSLLAIRKDISSFLHRVGIDEQPFARVAAMTSEVVRRTGITPMFSFDKSILQTRAHLMTTSLLLRCDYDILSDLLKIHRERTPRQAEQHAWLKKDLTYDLSRNRADCMDLVNKASSKQQPMIVVEAYILFAKFAGLERMAPINADQSAALIAEGNDALATARTHIAVSPSTASMLEEVEAAEKMLREETFYTTVTNDEKQQVYLAMAQEFLGTGHWYYCENMHPVRLSPD